MNFLGKKSAFCLRFIHKIDFLGLSVKAKYSWKCNGSSFTIFCVSRIYFYFFLLILELFSRGWIALEASTFKNPFKSELKDSILFFPARFLSFPTTTWFVMTFDAVVLICIILICRCLYEGPFFIENDDGRFFTLNGDFLLYLFDNGNE